MSLRLLSKFEIVHREVVPHLGNELALETRIVLVSTRPIRKLEKTPVSLCLTRKLEILQGFAPGLEILLRERTADLKIRNYPP